MTADEARADYREAMDTAGQWIAIRRYTGAGEDRPWFEAPARARIVGYDPDELVGNIQQGDRRVILLYEDMIAAQFPVPPRRGDKAVVGGRELNVESVDDEKRRFMGELMAYELQVRG